MLSAADLGLCISAAVGLFVEAPAEENDAAEGRKGDRDQRDQFQLELRAGAGQDSAGALVIEHGDPADGGGREAHDPVAFPGDARRVVEKAAARALGRLERSGDPETSTSDCTGPWS